jgi:superfamily II DNA helicase RecQ
VRLEDDSFVKDGAPVHFQRVYRAGARGGEQASDRARPRFTIAGEGPRKSHRTKSSKGRKERGHGKRPRGAVRAPSASAASAAAHASGALFEALRAWRLAEAKRTGLPAFRVMNDRTLLGIATETPKDEGALLRVAGIGPGLSRRYGAALLRIVSRFARS